MNEIIKIMPFQIFMQDKKNEEENDYKPFNLNEIMMPLCGKLN